MCFALCSRGAVRQSRGNRWSTATIRPTAGGKTRQGITRPDLTQGNLPLFNSTCGGHRRSPNLCDKSDVGGSVFMTRRERFFYVLVIYMNKCLWGIDSLLAWNSCYYGFINWLNKRWLTWLWKDQNKSIFIKFVVLYFKWIIVGTRKLRYIIE